MLVASLSVERRESGRGRETKGTKRGAKSVAETKENHDKGENIFPSFYSCVANRSNVLNFSSEFHHRAAETHPNVVNTALLGCIRPIAGLLCGTVSRSILCVSQQTITAPNCKLWCTCREFDQQGELARVGRINEAGFVPKCL